MEGKKQTKYRRYKHGQLVMVDFGKGMDHEFSFKHPAIVLTKDDNPLKGTVTVIPLSSKFHKHYLPLGMLINPYSFQELCNSILMHIEIDKKTTSEICNFNPDTDSPENLMERINSIRPSDYINDGKRIVKILQMYFPLVENSYALVTDITTVSKLKIMKPVNKYDPLTNLIVSKEVMKKIYSKITELYIKDL